MAKCVQVAGIIAHIRKNDQIYMMADDNGDGNYYPIRSAGVSVQKEAEANCYRRKVMLVVQALGC